VISESESGSDQHFLLFCSPRQSPRPRTRSRSESRFKSLMSDEGSTIQIPGFSEIGEQSVPGCYLKRSLRDDCVQGRSQMCPLSSIQGQRIRWDRFSVPWINPRALDRICDRGGHTVTDGVALLRTTESRTASVFVSDTECRLQQTLFRVPKNETLTNLERICRA
jgi:hypothetical protein